MPATPGASIAENHDRGGGGAGLAAGPALAEIRAASLLADSVEIQFPELLLNLHVLLASGDGLLHPFRLGKGILLGADLDGVRAVGFEVTDEVGERRSLRRQASSQAG